MPWQMFDAAGRELVGTHAAGSNTEIQFNDAGVLAGSSNYTFNKTTLEVDQGVMKLRPNVGTSNGDVSNEYGAGLTVYVDHDNTFGLGANRTYFANATNDVTLVTNKNNVAHTMEFTTPNATAVTWDSQPLAAIYINPPPTATTRNFLSGIWVNTNGASLDKGRGIGVTNAGLSDSFYTQLDGAGGAGYAALLNGDAAIGVTVETRGTNQVGAHLQQGVGGGTGTLAEITADISGAAEMVRVNSSQTSKTGLIFRMSGSGNQALVVKDGSDNTIAAILADTGLILSSGLVSSGSMVSITGATTATISRTHIVTGTTADYTITLPAASGNGGKYLSFVFGPTLTELSKFVTLDGNGTEKIDGALTRVCWAGESCTLLCDGSNWFKIGGKTIPMQCNMSKSTGQSCSASTDTKVLLDTSDFDNTGSMADTTNSKIVCRRTGRYSVNGMGYWNPSVTASLFQHNVRINNVGSGFTLLTNVGLAGWFAGGTATSLDEAVTTGQDIELYADQFTVGTETFNSPKLQAVELIGW